MSFNMKKRKKICILTIGKYPVPATEGGAVEALVEIMAENAQYSCHDYDIDIISKYNDEAKEKSLAYDKINFIYIKNSPLSIKLYSFIKRVVRKLFHFNITTFNPYLIKALKIIKENSYDIIIAENTIYFIKPLKKYCKSKVVFHLHNDHTGLSVEPSDRLIRKTDMIIGVSDFVSERVKKAKGFNSPVVTVKNVTDTKKFQADERKLEKAKELRKKYGFSDDDIICLFVGRLIPEKGIDILVDAISNINDKHIKLLIVGGTSFSDSQRTEFESLLHKKAEFAEGRILFTGYVSYDRLPSFYQVCDVAVFPSQWEEAAGLVVLEAQSAGKPVIISRSGGMPEYVCEKSAVLVDMGKNFQTDLERSIIELSHSKERREQMGRAGVRYSAQFDKHGYLDRIITAIEKTVYD